MAGPHAGNRNRPAYSGQSRFRFPKQIIELFAARPPLKFKPPPKRRRLPPMTGIAAYVHKFGTLPPPTPAPPTKDAKTEPVKMELDIERKAVPTTNQPKNTHPTEIESTQAKHTEALPSKSEPLETASRSVDRSPEEPFETPARRRARKRDALDKARKARLKEATATWDPFANEAHKTRDPRRTLFVSGFAKDTPTARLRAEFENYGRVAELVVPTDPHGVPRGYAFVEFERDTGLQAAYDGARGRKIDGRRVIVDVERARTSQGWRPNRLEGPNAMRRRPVPNRHERSPRMHPSRRPYNAR